MKIIRISNELGDANWKAFLEAWGAAMDRYVALSGDLPYWYNERSNASCLAGAAWSLGGASIEEYGVERHSGTEASQGRCDLWIHVLDLKIECEIEAKITWSKTFSTMQAEISELIKGAKEQLKTLLEKPQERAPFGIAICFVCPEVKVSGEGEKLLSALDTFGTSNEKDYSLVAVYKPPLSVSTYDSGMYFPGVALIGQMIWDPKLLASIKTSVTT